MKTITSECKECRKLYNLILKARRDLMDAEFHFLFHEDSIHPEIQKKIRKWTLGKITSKQKMLIEETEPNFNLRRIFRAFIKQHPTKKQNDK